MQHERIDVSTFLNPISAEKKCGVFLRYEPVYDQIQHARLEDDVRLSMGVWERDLKRADWAFVKEKCTDILQNQSKDFQICVWLLESWTMLYSWEGVGAGLDLLYQMCEKFWDEAYPSLDGDENDTRVVPFSFLSTKYADRLLSLPIFAHDEVHNILLSELYDAASSINMEYVVSSYRHKCGDLKIFADAMHASSQNVERLDDFLHEKLGEQAPSMRFLSERLDKVVYYLQNLIARIENDSESADTTESVAAFSEGNAGSGGLRCKENALDLEIRVNSLDEAYDALDVLRKFISEQAGDHASAFLVRIAAEMRGMKYEDLLQKERDLVQAFCVLGAWRTNES